jgi:hypothetical protein
MAQEETPLWIILIFMPLVVPLVAYPISKRGWTNYIHHLKRGHMYFVARLYALIWKLLVLLLGYFITGFLVSAFWLLF